MAMPFLEDIRNGCFRVLLPTYAYINIFLLCWLVGRYFENTNGRTSLFNL